MNDLSPLSPEDIAKLLELHGRTTQGPWLFHDVNSREGDSIDVLVVKIGIAAPDEDQEYAQVLSDESILGESQVDANWLFIQQAHEAVPRMVKQIADQQERINKLLKCTECGGFREESPDLNRDCICSGAGTRKGQIAGYRECIRWWQSDVYKEKNQKIADLEREIERLKNGR